MPLSSKGGLAGTDTSVPSRFWSEYRRRPDLQGLLVGPECESTQPEPMPNSSVLVLPTTTAPDETALKMLVLFDLLFHETLKCETLYRASQVVVHLGWVDLDLGCSTTLPGQ